MRFNDNARLDTSQVEDRRGRGGFSPMGGVAAGGGGLGLLGIVVALLLGVNPFQGTAPYAETTGTGYGSPGRGVEVAGSAVQQECRTGADANAREDCRIVGLVNSIQAFWEDEFQRRGGRYEPAQTQLFSGSTQGACGYASAAQGPFYCPLDQKAYIDLEFFRELETRFGARGGPFAQAYVLAHEYGHHVQNLSGVLQQERSNATGPQSAQVRIELQADCLAAVWARNATQTGYIEQITQQDINDGLDAAAAVGDDRIQRATQGRVQPESWTHGSAEQRQRWFMTGYRTGDINACDTSRGQV